MRCRGSKLGRIQNDDIEAACLISQATQQLKNVSANPLRVVQFIELRIRARRVEGKRRAFDRDDRLCAAPKCIQCKATRVAETIENLLVVRKLAQSQAIVSLVQIEAGLVARVYFHFEREAVL